MKIIIATIFTVIFSTSVFCASTEIFGKAPTYAGTTITFTTYADYITNTDKIICTIPVNDSGDFRGSFDISGAMFIHSMLGIYDCFMFIEPGKKYEIILPERADKTTTDLLNPYFSPYTMQIAIKGQKMDDLNLMIKMFNDTYRSYYHKHIENNVQQPDFSKLEESVEQLEDNFPDTENAFFNSYKKYRIGMLRHLAAQHKSKKISDEFFNDQQIEYTNPGYMELFNQVYDKYILFFGRTSEGKKIYDDIASKDYFALSKRLKKDKVLSNDALRELVILKQLHDEFYDDNFSRAALLIILDTLRNTTNIPYHAEIADNIYGKVTKLLAGYKAPSFSLYDKDSVLVSLEDYQGKYVYLNFCISQSYTCIKEFEMLKSLQARLKDKFEIVSIVADENFSAVTDFIEQSGYNWKFLHYGNQVDILKEYDIRGFPTYFFIDKEGKMAISPAPTPEGNIEKSIFETMRANGDI